VPVSLAAPGTIVVRPGGEDLVARQRQMRGARCASRAAMSCSSSSVMKHWKRCPSTSEKVSYAPG
jgi:hypothetical protein